MDRAAVQTVRRFNRTVAEGIGLLGDRFLDRARPMGESRVLWEIGPTGAEIRELRARLGLDSGYVSRVLGSLTAQRLVKVRVSKTDRRVRRAELTAAGLAERASLDRRSDAAAAGILEKLSPTQAARLVTAMADVERLLEASMVQFEVEDPASADARWCIDQYFAELASRFDAGFYPDRTLAASPRELVPPAGALVVARLRGRPVACGALKFHGRGPAELKHLWVAADHRGLGLGRGMLDALERRARDGGAKAVRLDTNRALTEAIAMYRKAGYVEVPRFNDEPYAHHWFEKRLR